MATSSAGLHVLQNSVALKLPYDVLNKILWKLIDDDRPSWSTETKLDLIAVIKSCRHWRPAAEEILYLILSFCPRRDDDKDLSLYEVKQRHRQAYPRERTRMRLCSRTLSENPRLASYVNQLALNRKVLGPKQTMKHAVDIVKACPMLTLFDAGNFGTAHLDSLKSALMGKKHLTGLTVLKRQPRNSVYFCSMSEMLNMLGHWPRMTTVNVKCMEASMYTSFFQQPNPGYALRLHSLNLGASRSTLLNAPFLRGLLSICESLKLFYACIGDEAENVDAMKDCIVKWGPHLQFLEVLTPKGGIRARRGLLDDVVGNLTNVRLLLTDSVFMLPDALSSLSTLAHLEYYVTCSSELRGLVGILNATRADGVPRFWPSLGLLSLGLCMLSWNVELEDLEVPDSEPRLATSLTKQIADASQNRRMIMNTTYTDF